MVFCARAAGGRGYHKAVTATIATVHAALIDNAGYEESASPSMCRAYITALKQWMLFNPQSVSQMGASVTHDLQTLRAMLEDAQAWLASNDTTAAAAVGGATFADFRGGRE